jgi:hypothetical protein
VPSVPLQIDVKSTQAADAAWVYAIQIRPPALVTVAVILGLYFSGIWNCC